MTRRNQEPTLWGRCLTRSYGKGELTTVVLREVSMKLYRGEVALLMGPSGSGKSTLLAVLSGLLRPDEGQTIALGQDLWCLSEAERERFRQEHCGFVFQGFNLFPALTARQQLEMVLCWSQGTTPRQARWKVDAMLSLLGLANKGHLRPAQLSGGEKQRVAVGRALIKSPELCFADEPTSALDWCRGQLVIEALRQAARERGTTVLIVAHDARIIPYVDRVFHLEEGRLAEPAPCALRRAA
jgi:putative ABC transport system ATP-binding protein